MRPLPGPPRRVRPWRQSRSFSLAPVPASMASPDAGGGPQTGRDKGVCRERTVARRHALPQSASGPVPRGHESRSPARRVLLPQLEEGHHGLGVAVGMWWPSSFFLFLLFLGVELDLREVRGDSSAGRLPPAATLRGELDPPTVGNEGRWGVVPPVGPVPLKGFPPCRPGRLAAPEVLRLRSGRRGGVGAGGSFAGLGDAAPGRREPDIGGRSTTAPVGLGTRFRLLRASCRSGDPSVTGPPRGEPCGGPGVRTPQAGRGIPAEPSNLRETRDPRRSQWLPTPDLRSSPWLS